MLSSCEYVVLLSTKMEVGFLLHGAICQARAGWHNVRPNMNLHCVIEVSSFRLRWQMDKLCRQTACVQEGVEMVGWWC